jgi:hypothetical protein
MTDLTIRGIAFRDVQIDQGATRELIVRGLPDRGRTVDELLSLCDPPAEFPIVRPIHVADGAVTIEQVCDCRISQITLERGGQVRISTWVYNVHVREAHARRPDHVPTETPPPPQASET